MDTNSKKLQDNLIKFKKFKNVGVIIFVTTLILAFLFNPNKEDIVFICLLSILIYIGSKKMINECKLLLLHQHIREIQVMDKNMYQILEETNQESQINVMLGKKYKKITKQMNEVQEYIYKSTLRGKQSEAMIDRVISDVAKNLVNPIDNISNNIKILKDDNYNLSTLDNIEVEVYELKNTISELFELSKAVTNTMELNIEKLEINSLIKQSLIEYGNKFNELNLNSKKNFNLEKIYVDADGEKLWRVFEIILDNVVNYSKENTRIYLNSDIIEDKVIISIMNISKEELNISVDDFNKKINENSCLGLAIAINLMNIQKGNLRLDIDGDLFKVSLEFDTIKDNNERGEDEC